MLACSSKDQVILCIAEHPAQAVLLERLQNSPLKARLVQRWLLHRVVDSQTTKNSQLSRTLLAYLELCYQNENCAPYIASQFL